MPANVPVPDWIVGNGGAGGHTYPLSRFVDVTKKAEKAYCYVNFTSTEGGCQNWAAR